MSPLDGAVPCHGPTEEADIDAGHAWLLDPSGQRRAPRPDGTDA